MPSKKQKLLKISSYVVLVIILLLLLLVGSLKIFVPVIVNNSLKSVSTSKQVDLSVKRAEFSIKNGLKIKNLKLSDNEKIPLEIEKLFVKPDYISSLKQKKLIFNTLDIDSPNLDASSESIKTFTKLFERADDKKQDNESKLHIKKIDVENLVVHINEKLKLSLDKVDINWQETQKNNLFFDLKGLISINENDSSEFGGNVSVDQKEKIASVDFNIGDIKKQINSPYLKIPSDLSANIKTNVNYAKEIKSDGKINFISNQSVEVGKFSYDILYGSESDFILKNAALILNDFLTLNANGAVKNLKGSKDFDISSELKIEDLNKISGWTTFVEDGELNGNLKTDVISLKGSSESKSLDFIAEGKIKDGVFSASNYSAENFEIDFDLSRNFSETKSHLGLNFNANKLRLDLPGDSNTSLEKLYTKERLNLKIYNEPGVNLKIDGDKFNFKNIRHDYFSTNNGTVENLKLTLNKGGGFVLTGNLNGNGFNAKGVKISDVDIDFNTEKYDTEIITTGKLKLQNGSFKTFLLDKYEGAFTQNGKTVKLHDSTLKGNHPQKGNAELVEIRIPDEGNSDIKIDFLNAILFELQDKIKSKINSASLIVNSKTADIRGKVKAQNLIFNNQVLKNPIFDLELISQKLKLKNIKSNFFNGNLNGDITLDLNNRPYDFSSNLKLYNPVIENGDTSYPLKSLATDFKGKLDNKIVNSTGSIDIDELKISKDIYETKLSSDIKLNIKDETINIESGFINSEDSKKVNFTGKINNFSSDNRKVEVKFEETELDTLKKVLYPFLPFEIQEGDLSGTIKPRIGIVDTGDNYEWLGKVEIKDANLETLISLTELSVKGINGVFTLDNKSFSRNPVSDILGKDFNINKEVFENYQHRLKDSKAISDGDYLRIDEINYSFLNIKNIETLFDMNSSKVIVNYFKSDIYRGNVLGAGVINMDKRKYNFSLLFDDLSLDGISDSIPSIKDYMTGRFNGMMWINAGKNIGKTDGLFSIWAIKSKKEKLSVGKPLLERIGATGRFFTGSSRSYDKGLISGYIKEGFMTFKELEITNSVLGYKDLKIRVDEKKNSISLNQLFSVIREIAKRASEGGIKVDFEK